MKVGDTRRPGGVSKVAPAPQAVADITSVLGIAEAEFSPKVRAAIMALMAEVEKLRRELEQSKRRISYLEELADQDTLTPIPNRRAFVRELSRMVSYAERYQTPSSLLFFDVNGLKEINDAHGHAAGDAVTTFVAEVLSKNIRDTDFVARIGDDEIGVLLAHADHAIANEKATTLMTAIEAEPLTWQTHKFRVSAVVGVHTFRGGEDVNQALDAADRAMYARKRARPAPPRPGKA